MRGLVPFHTGLERSAFPHSLEYVAIPLRSLLNDEGQLRPEVIDVSLDAVATLHCQAVLRVVIDTPAEPTGIPAYLIKAGLKTHIYEEHGGGLCPDYADENLIRTLESFIAAFGKRFDGDTRLGFVQAGLLGFWGEWHTWPRSEWAPTPEVEARVAGAYARAFRKTPVLLRRPSGDASKSGFGFHDDSFGLTTLPGEEWHFLTQLRAAGLSDIWKTRPIGGEVRPELQTHVIRGSVTTDPAMQDIGQCLGQTHASWLLFEEVFTTTLDSADLERVRAFSARLGYELRALSGSVSKEGGGARVRLELENSGAAPFYAPWRFEAVWVDAKGKALGQPLVLPWTPQGLLPGDRRSFSHRLGQLPRSAQGIKLRVANPLAGGSPLRLANKGSDPEGFLTIPISSS